MEKKNNKGKRSESSSAKKTKQMRQSGSDKSDSSLSSLGSLPDAPSITRHFSDHFSHSPTESATGPHVFTSINNRHTTAAGSSNRHRQIASQKKVEGKARKSDSDITAANRTCPHCRRVFVNSWAVPKHVMMVHDNTNLFHCTKCAFNNLSKERLDEHERRAHRTCPHCGKVFVFLDRHIGNCRRRNSDK